MSLTTRTLRFVVVCCLCGHGLIFLLAIQINSNQFKFAMHISVAKFLVDFLNQIYFMLFILKWNLYLINSLIATLIIMTMLMTLFDKSMTMVVMMLNFLNFVNF